MCGQISYPAEITQECPRLVGGQSSRFARGNPQRGELPDLVHRNADVIHKLSHNVIHRRVCTTGV